MSNITIAPEYASAGAIVTEVGREDVRPLTFEYQGFQVRSEGPSAAMSALVAQATLGMRHGCR